MYIVRMTARFGRLQNETLAPGRGLTVVEAPNESGKSTWCSFLCTMLYGFPARERGALADKNRYAPWNGTPMSGTVELVCEGRGITISRDSVGSGSPMGHFAAVYTGTTQEVPGPDAASCGDILLGVPREVFERSAFLREASVGIHQNAELERRIAALLSTGEEESSFSEVYTLLKSQLTRRRYNQTGLLPKTEAELAAAEEELQRCEALHAEWELHRRNSEILRAEEAALQEQLRQHTLADAAEEQREIDTLRRLAEEAERQAAECQKRLEDDHIPPMEELQKLAARLDSLRETERAGKTAADTLVEASGRCEKAEQTVAAHPLAPASPEELEKQPLPVEKRPAFPFWAPLSGIFGGAAGWYWGGSVNAALLCGCGLAAIASLIAGLITGARRKKWGKLLTAAAEEKRRALADYTALYQTMLTAREAKEKAKSSLSVLTDTAAELCKSLVEAVQLFAPEVESKVGAAAALEKSFCMRKLCEEAERLAQERKLRYDVRRQHRRFEEVHTDAVRPDADRESLSAALQETHEALLLSLEQEHRTEGALAGLTPYTELCAKRDALLAERNRLQGEYNAIALAMETLSSANDELQSRFAPALGHRAAEIFSRLTGGRYESVLLDRELRPSAAEKGDFTARNVALLSRGCADQLYLALRLAICETVLPPEKNIPLIFDDAFLSFDDERMSAALQYLLEESRRRQIILFTCHDRERKALEGADGVTFLHL